VSTMDERDGGTLERDPSTPVVPLEGDNIVVLPDGGDGHGGDRAPRRSRPVLVGAVTLALVLIIGVIALVTHGSSSKPRLQTTSPPPSLPVVAKVHRTPAKPHQKPKPKVAITTVPATLPKTSVTSGHVVVAPPSPPASTPVAPTPTTVEPIAQYGPSVLQWAAPGPLVIAGGASKTFSITAHNPTPGMVTLPHPLSCAPRLDHSEVCPEVVQVISPQQSASAQYTIDARGVAAGHYTLRIEGVLTIDVTVTGPPSSTPPS
jgi:hypothetical protein